MKSLYWCNNFWNLCNISTSTLNSILLFKLINSVALVTHSVQRVHSTESVGVWMWEDTYEKTYFIIWYRQTQSADISHMVSIKKIFNFVCLFICPSIFYPTDWQGKIWYLLHSCVIKFRCQMYIYTLWQLIIFFSKEWEIYLK